MKLVIILLVCFFSSAAGSICGIGGGVIIKPALDASGILDAASASFLSGCTVLAMSAISLYKNLRNTKAAAFDQTFASVLTSGSVIGGILGKSAFQYILQHPTAKSRAAAIQSAILLLLTAGTLAYELHKEKITPKHIQSQSAVFCIGCLLGILSAFLGIGGGPVNLIVLFYFFSMQTKEAALYSIYIILFSQTASLLVTILAGTVPDFSAALLFLMTSCGVLGGLAGSAVSRRIDSKTVDRLFSGLMLVIILISLSNIFRYYGSSFS